MSEPVLVFCSMAQRLITLSKFALLAGVNRTSIYKAKHRNLKEAMVGGKIDLTHPVALAYLKKKGVDPEVITRSFGISDSELNPDHLTGGAAAKAKKKTKQQASKSNSQEVTEGIQDLVDLTLRELIERFGTDVRFVDWLSASQKIEMIHEKRLKNASTRGQLVNRDLVKVGVIDPINSAHLRLMKDGAKSIAAGAVSKHEGGASLSEIEAYVSDIIGSFIKPIKNKVSRALRKQDEG